MEFICEILIRFAYNSLLDILLKNIQMGNAFQICYNNCLNRVIAFFKPESAKQEGQCYIWSENLQETLCPGTMISFKGRILPECKRFIVNLMSIKKNKSDIAFHFNPRLAQRYVVRNSYLNGSWGEEETTSVGVFQLSRNLPFELCIICTDREFLVSVNDKHFCAYVFRTPLDTINRIQVEGPVNVKSIERSLTSFYPKSSPQNVPFIVPSGDGDQNRIADQQLHVPVTASLTEGFHIGWQLEISGRTKILPSSFYINLQNGQYLWPHPTIPLHLNPRFYTSYGNHLFIRNSWINGEWGSEERTPGFQFTPASKFHLAIRKMENHFAVWVDGQLAGEFEFRFSADEIDTVFVHGDVEIIRIFLKKGIDDKYFTQSKEKLH